MNNTKTLSSFLSIRIALIVSLVTTACVEPQEVDGANEAESPSASASEDGTTGAVGGEAPRLVTSASELKQLLGDEDSGKVSKAANCFNAGLVSHANGRLVSAEFGWGGDNWSMLRARATAFGPWELFQFCSEGGSWMFRSNLEGWVSTELGWGGDRYGMLRARAGSIGPWERYQLFDLGGGAYAIRSSANGSYVSAELGWGGDNYGMLRGRAGVIGPWEVFSFVAP